MMRPTDTRLPYNKWGTFSTTPGLSMSAQSRIRALEEFFPSPPERLLEFGALDAPTFKPNQLDIKFADVFSNQELEDHYVQAGKRSPEKFVPVSYVLKDSTIPETIKESFDLVIANHMLEHFPDPIRWLNDVRTIVKDNGHLFLALPDRRYTFDFFKPASDVVDWLEMFERSSSRPTSFQILRQLYCKADHDHKRAWRGIYPNQKMRRISLTDAIKKSKQLAEEYTDVHCSHFTAQEFLEIIQDLSSSEFIRWKCVKAWSVEAGQNEFKCMLKAI